MYILWHVSQGKVPGLEHGEAAALGLAGRLGVLEVGLGPVEVVVPAADLPVPRGNVSS